MAICVGLTAHKRRREWRRKRERPASACRAFIARGRVRRATIYLRVFRPVTLAAGCAAATPIWLAGKLTILVLLAGVAYVRSVLLVRDLAPPTIALIACLSSSTLSGRSLIRIAAMMSSREGEGFHAIQYRQFRRSETPGALREESSRSARRRKQTCIAHASESDSRTRGRVLGRTDVQP